MLCFTDSSPATQVSLQNWLERPNSMQPLQCQSLYQVMPTKERKIKNKVKKKRKEKQRNVRQHALGHNELSGLPSHVRTAVWPRKVRHNRYWVSLQKTAPEPSSPLKQRHTAPVPEQLQLPRADSPAASAPPAPRTRLESTQHTLPPAAKTERACKGASPFLLQLV